MKVTETVGSYTLSFEAANPKAMIALMDAVGRHREQRDERQRRNAVGPEFFIVHEGVVPAIGPNHRRRNV